MKKIILIIPVLLSYVAIAQTPKKKTEVKETKVELINVVEDPDNLPPPPPPPPQPGEEIIEEPVPPHYDNTPPDTNMVYNIVEQMPKFPGGDDSLMNFIRGNIVYPAAAKDAGNKGGVYIEFIIEKDGTISNVKMMRGMSGPGGQDCNDEALRVVKLLPRWQPGMQNGKAVRVKFIMPIRFQLI